MIKIIASDMDGTLLNSDIEVSEENVKAIETARAEGIHFVLCTGRMYKDAMELSKRAKLHAPAICMNGAEIRDENGKVLLQHTIDKDLARKTYKILIEHGLYTEIFTEIGPITTNKATGKAFMIEMQKKLHPEVSSNEISKKIEERFEAKDVHERKDSEKIFANDDLHVFKFIAFSADESKLAQAKKRLMESNLLAVSSSGHENIEITHTEAQKGISLQYYAEKRGVTLEETFAIGDNNNDISMLKMAGYTVAMGNAEADVKKVAKYTTKTNDENGVAAAIYEMLKNNH
ncbi:Cof-type HAD-IIB family hydrolase [Listeria grayi]|uniref:Cof-like hydrolase n=1 Tax=Listeria grayi DSM 20601 TaxID=525367 RepID=D7V0B3_LISGR|nr:Cof-type HAD-IIB family hydrolase [Listeria grayi]EFI83006.1 Cof-like hydrolase [Listeria grayi DSM 20601]